MSDAATHPKTHNLPPIVAPTELDMFEDLQRRFPELEAKAKEFEKALSEYPEELKLADEEVAAALQDLLGQMRKHQNIIAAHKKGEKKPWDGIVKVVMNFFTKHDDRIDKLLSTWAPRHQAFLELKKADAQRKAEEEAERQRQKAEADRKAAEEAEARAAAARAEEEAARERERIATEAAERAEQERIASVARAEAARKEEQRLAEEKRKRDKAERDNNETALRGAARHMRAAETLHAFAEQNDATADEARQLDELIRPGGVIGILIGPVSTSLLLTDEQRTEIEGTRTRLGELRTALAHRLDEKQRKEREEAAKAEAEAQAKARAEAEAKAKAEAEAIAKAAADRAAEEERARAAKEEKKQQTAAAREARDDAKEAAQGAKVADRQASVLDESADRSDNRADRIETRLGKSTDADLSRTRGDLGTTGSLTRHWTYSIVDEQALRAGFIVPGHEAPCAGLAEHLMSDALAGAVYRWMRAHQGSWTKERIDDALPGVVFMYEQGSTIR